MAPRGPLPQFIQRLLLAGRGRQVRDGIVVGQREGGRKHPLCELFQRVHTDDVQHPGQIGRAGTDVPVREGCSLFQLGQ